MATLGSTRLNLVRDQVSQLADDAKGSQNGDASAVSSMSMTLFFVLFDLRNKCSVLNETKLSVMHTIKGHTAVWMEHIGVDNRAFRI